MASPQVAGYWLALYYNYSPEFTPPQVKARLLDECWFSYSIYSSADNDWTDRRSLLGGEPKVCLINSHLVTQPY